MDIVIVGLVFVTCVLLSCAIFQYVTTSGVQRVLKERIEGKSTPNQAKYTYLKACVSKGLSNLGRANAPKDDADASKLRKQLQAAGYRTATAPIVFAGVKSYVLLASIGFYAPQIWLSKKIASRQRKIAEGFPDALDLMVICVEAGLGLNSAVGRIGDEMKLVHKELSEEFHFLSLELRTGLSRQQALRNLSARIGLDEIKSLVAVLIQTERFGTSVSHALSILSTAMRQTRQHKAEEQAAKLPAKLLFPLMVFIFPNLFIVILGPTALRMMRTLLPTLSQTGGN